MSGKMKSPAPKRQTQPSTMPSKVRPCFAKRRSQWKVSPLQK